MVIYQMEILPGQLKQIAFKIYVKWRKIMLANSIKLTRNKRYQGVETYLNPF